MDERFWRSADELVRSSQVVIDRPKGSRHPRIHEIIYPLDYGYLADTTGGDGDGVDVWIGSLSERLVVGAIMTVDTHKRDSEVKLLIGCTKDEADLALATHNTGSQAAVLIRRADSTEAADALPGNGS